MARDFAGLWHKYSQYNETNTVMISPFYNLIEDYQRNDLILPLYDPITGVTDMHDDKHLTFCAKYIDFLASIEQ